MSITFKDNSTKQPILTRKIYDLLIFAYSSGYGHGVSAAENKNYDEYSAGIIDLLTEYFKTEDDNR